MLSKGLHVGEKMFGCVGREIGVSVGGVWLAPAAVALVEEDDAVNGGVEVAAACRLSSRSQDRRGGRRPAFPQDCRRAPSR